MGSASPVFFFENVGPNINHGTCAGIQQVDVQKHWAVPDLGGPWNDFGRHGGFPHVSG